MVQLLGKSGSGYAGCVNDPPNAERSRRPGNGGEEILGYSSDRMFSERCVLLMNLSPLFFKGLGID